MSKPRTRQIPVVLGNDGKPEASDTPGQIVSGTPRVARTPPPGDSDGVIMGGTVQISNVTSDVRSGGLSNVLGTELTSAAISELKTEVAQLKEQMRVLQERLNDQIGVEELYERVTECRAEMRDFRREIEARIEREAKTQAQRIADVRKEVRDSLENCRRQIAAHRNAYADETINQSQRLNALRRDSVESRWAHNESIRLDATMAAANRPFLVKPQMPTFEGKPTERPAKFMREMKRFVEATRLPDEELKFIIGQSLRGIAGEWWDIVSEEITTWAQFSQALRDRFWSPAIQRKVRDNLNVGVHRTESGVSRVAYAMKLIGTARDLIPRPTDEEIVQMLARHYTQAVDDCVLGQNINTIDTFLALLERFDNGGTVNRPKLEERPNTGRDWSARAAHERMSQPTNNLSRSNPMNPTQARPNREGQRQTADCQRPVADYQRPVADYQRPVAEHQRPKYDNARPWQDHRRPPDRLNDSTPNRIRVAHVNEDVLEEEEADAPELEATAEND